MVEQLDFMKNVVSAWYLSGLIFRDIYCGDQIDEVDVKAYSCVMLKLRENDFYQDDERNKSIIDEFDLQVKEAIVDKEDHTDTSGYEDFECMMCEMFIELGEMDFDSDLCNTQQYHIDYEFIALHGLYKNIMDSQVDMINSRCPDGYYESKMLGVYRDNIFKYSRYVVECDGIIGKDRVFFLELADEGIKLCDDLEPSDCYETKIRQYLLNVLIGYGDEFGKIVKDEIKFYK